MANISSKAFVLSAIKYRDHDRLVRLLTPSLGLITAAARGAGKPNHQLASLSAPFVFADYELFYYRDRYTINSGQVIYPFQELSDDLVRLTAAAHLAEVFTDCLKEGSADRINYELWGRSLWQLSDQQDPILTVHLAQVRLLANLGFRPWLKNCVNCHVELSGNYRFSFPEAGLICNKPACQQKTMACEQAGRPLCWQALSPASLSALNYILSRPQKEIFNFRSDNGTRKLLIQFSAQYLTYTMEKTYKKLMILEQFKKLEDGLLGD